MTWQQYHKDNYKKQSFTKTIKRQIEQLEIKSVLELGCGQGLNLAQLSREISKTGVDFDRFAIDEAIKNLPDSNLILSDILDFDTNRKYDLVFTCAVLEHLSTIYYDYMIKKMKKLSNKYIICIEAYDEDKKERTIDWWRKITFNTINLRKRFEENGLKVIRDFPLDSEYWICLARL